MGCFDTFGKHNVQLKVGECLLNQYDLNKKVDIPDGVYVGYEGVIVIKNGKLIAEFDQITDKWNNKIKNEDILHSRNEVQKVLLSLEKERSLNLVLDRVEQLGQLPLFVDIKNKAVKLAVENRLKKSPQSKRKIHWK